MYRKLGKRVINSAMAHFRGQREAFGAPGLEPRWTDADKDGIGTAYSSGGRVWFTLRRGILTEVYYPTIDHPQLRDMEFLFADGDGLSLKKNAISNRKLSAWSLRKDTRLPPMIGMERCRLPKKLSLNRAGPAFWYTPCLMAILAFQKA